jgi:acyl phosphate:glycerol-3-phosphate acyltransferase
VTLAALLAAYAIGAVPIGFLVARAFGIGDLRRHGSGNIGMTNVLRTAGRWPAVLTLVGDVGKGYLAVVVAGAIAARDPAVMAAAAVSAVVGNCWSIFLGFRGGKGVATGLGALLRLVPWAVLPAAVVWLAVTLTTRYVSLGSIMAALGIALGALVLGYPTSKVLACAAIAAIVVFRHHENITRLLAGNERRIGARAGAR